MDFESIGEITHLATIASGSGVRDRARLRKQYGQGRWRKLKGHEEEIKPDTDICYLPR